MRRHLKRIHRHIIPHHENGGRPAFFEWENLLRFGLALVVLVGFISGSRPLLRSDSLGAAVIASKVLDLENSVRVSAKLPRLKENKALADAAYKKAYDMIGKGYFAHVTPEGDAPWKFINDAGYGYIYAGENLALDFGESSDVVSAWIASPAHKENVMGLNFSETGIAVVEGEYQGKTRTFVVQMFGSAAEGVPLEAPAPSILLSSPREVPAVLGVSTYRVAAVSTVSLIDSLPRALLVVLFLVVLLISYALYHFLHGPHRHLSYALLSSFLMILVVGGVTALAPRVSRDSQIPTSTLGASIGDSF